MVESTFMRLRPCACALLLTDVRNFDCAAVGICFSELTAKTSTTSRMASNEQPVADIALIGLAVMGQNIILNMNDHGFVVCAYNRTTEKVRAEEYSNDKAVDKF